MFDVKGFYNKKIVWCKGLYNKKIHVIAEDGSTQEIIADEKFILRVNKDQDLSNLSSTKISIINQ